MMRFRFSFILCLLFALSVHASHHKAGKQHWTGYLMDALCARDRHDEKDLGPSHTTKCLQMPSCQRSGYGILTDDNSFLKFDAAGNAKICTMLRNLDRTSNLRVEVWGSVEKDIVSISTIKVK